MKETEGVFLTNDEELKKWKVVSLSYMTKTLCLLGVVPQNYWTTVRGGGGANSNSESQPN